MLIKIDSSDVESDWIKTEENRRTEKEIHDNLRKRLRKSLLSILKRSTSYYGNFLTRIKPYVSDYTWDAAHKGARGHAGGKASPKKPTPVSAQEQIILKLCASDGSFLEELDDEDIIKLHDACHRPFVQKCLLDFLNKGGPGSGHFGHKGTPGSRGGSAPGGGLHLLLGRSTLLGAAGLDLPSGYEKNARESLARAISGISSQKARVFVVTNDMFREDVEAAGAGWKLDLSTELSNVKTVGDQLRLLHTHELENVKSTSSGEFSLGIGVARQTVINDARASIVGKGLSNHIDQMEGNSAFTKGGRAKPYAADTSFEWINKHVQSDVNLKVEVRADRSGRAYAFPEKNQIFVGKSETRATIIHEVGHVWEYNSTKVKESSAAFMEHRTQGKPLIPLRTLVSNAGYDNDEKAVSDKFFDPYVGKSYGGKHTEVTSMGLGSVSKLSFDSRILRDSGHLALTLMQMEGNFP